MFYLALAAKWRQNAAPVYGSGYSHEKTWSRARADRMPLCSPISLFVSKGEVQYCTVRTGHEACYFVRLAGAAMTVLQTIKTFQLQQEVTAKKRVFKDTAGRAITNIQIKAFKCEKIIGKETTDCNYRCE